VKGLVVRNPWAWCIGRAEQDPAGKTVENRGWSTPVRGDIAIITGRRLDRAALSHPLVEATVGRWLGDSRMPGPWPWEQCPGAVTAVADLHHVCDDASLWPRLACACGPWAVLGQFHWQLRNVRVLPEPVPVRGWQGLRDLPADVEAAVVAALPAAHEGCGGC
jgi:hypothetical protein